MTFLSNNTTTTKTTKKSIFTTGLVALTLSSAVFLTGCGASSNEQTHAVLGSVVGGAIGHQFGKGRGKHVAEVLGAVIGGSIGANVGRRMDQRDQAQVSQTLENTPNYQKVAWNNQNTNTQYEFTPVNNYEGKVNGARTVCRDYVMDAWIDGRKQQVNGRACKNERGQWINAT